MLALGEPFPDRLRKPAHFALFLLVLVNSSMFSMVVVHFGRFSSALAPLWLFSW